jgi:hypothetical protein
LTLLVAGPVKALLGRSTHALVIWTVTVIIAVIGPIQDSGAEGAIAARVPSVSTATTVVRARRLSAKMSARGADLSTSASLLRMEDQRPRDRMS